MLASLLLPLAHAEDNAEPKFPVVKPAGMLFLRYAYDLTEGAEGNNSFSADRLYLRTDVQMNKMIGARITLDADRVKPATLGDGSTLTLDTKYRVFVKHAYVEVKGLGPIKIRAGMVDTPWGPYADGFTGNRYIADNFAKAVSVLPTADLGVSVLGTHAKGLVDWNLSFLNGEGYDKVELDAGKAIQARISVDPIVSQKERNLPISGYIGYFGHPTDGVPTLVYAGAVGFKMPQLLVWAELLGEIEGETSGMGYSATLNPRLPDIAGLVVRYDHWDPDTQADDDAGTTLIAGLQKEFIEKVAVAVTYERSWDDVAPDAPTHGVVVHAQAGF